MIKKKVKRKKKKHFLSLQLSFFPAHPSSPSSHPALVHSLHLGHQVGRAGGLDGREEHREQFADERRENGDLLQRLERARGVRAADRRQPLGERDHPVEPREEGRVLDVGDLREDALSRLVRLEDDVLVELLGVEAQGLVEGRAGVVVEVHGDVDLKKKREGGREREKVREGRSMGAKKKGGKEEREKK